MRDCPHARIEFCPLYVAAHESSGLGCDDGKLGEQDGCAVHRGMNYGKSLAKLWQANRGLVQECAERESYWLKMEQRHRNMKSAGLH
jgi:hypothetical protein